jgi:hypothetical protein
MPETSERPSAHCDDQKPPCVPESQDPNAERLNSWIGRTVRFDHGGKRLSGRLVAAHFTGFAGKGRIPDYQLTIAGASGAKMTVSMFETYADIE